MKGIRIGLFLALACTGCVWNPFLRPSVPSNEVIVPPGLKQPKSVSVQPEKPKKRPVTASQVTPANAHGQAEALARELEEEARQ